MRTLKPMLVLAGLGAVLLALILLPQRPLLAAPSETTFTVNTTDDRLDDDTSDGVCHTSVNTCALRAAIMQANHFTAPGETIIILPAGAYTLTRQVLGADGEDEGDLNLTSPLAANQSISLVGAGANVTSINANHIDRVMEIGQYRIASLSGVSLRNGNVSTTLTGGGLLNDGSSTVTNITVSTSHAVYGGGIFNSADGSLTVINSTIRHNTATNDGGGIFNYKNLTLVNSTISQNSAGRNGGGLYNNALSEANTNVYNATIYFNEADGDANLDGLGAGVFNESPGVLNLRNSLVAGNYLADQPVYDDCTGTIGLYGLNVMGVSVEGLSDCDFVGTGLFAFLNSFAYVGPLQDNGGPTWTHALLPGSNAIDGANIVAPFVCVGPDSNPLPTDQRGSPRVAGLSCDIGAFEYIPPLYLPLVVR